MDGGSLARYHKSSKHILSTVLSSMIRKAAACKDVSPLLCISLLRYMRLIGMLYVGSTKFASSQYFQGTKLLARVLTFGHRDIKLQNLLVDLKGAKIAILRQVFPESARLLTSALRRMPMLGQLQKQREQWDTYPAWDMVSVGSDGRDTADGRDTQKWVSTM
ncbi:hypothetical protein Dimus_035466 [Dionaea muscipula]